VVRYRWRAVGTGALISVAAACCGRLGPGFSCESRRWESVFAYTPCGNGVVDRDVWNSCGVSHEECDDGNDVDGDACDSSCLEEPSFECPIAGGSCRPATCGDGKVNGYLDELNRYFGEEYDARARCSYRRTNGAVPSKPSTSPPRCGDGAVPRRHFTRGHWHEDACE